MATAGPPPDPVYVFYGFDGGVGTVSFVELQGKNYLLTGDSTGESVLWDLVTRKRVWQHQEQRDMTPPSILACGRWSRGIWTHARGSCVRFWTVENEMDGPVNFCTIPCRHPGFCVASVLSKEDTNADFAAVPVEKDDHHGIAVYRLAESDPLLLANVDPQSRSNSSPIGAPMICILSQLPSPTNASVVDPLSLIVGYESGTVQVWQLDPPRQTLLAESKIVQETILGMDFSPSRRFGYCVSPEKTVNCWRLIHGGGTGGLKIESRGEIELPRAGAAAVRIRDDGKIFAVGGWDGKIRVFASKSMKALCVLQFHSDTIRCLDFCTGKIGGRKLLAVGSKDGSVSLWNLYSDV